MLCHGASSIQSLNLSFSSLIKYSIPLKGTTTFTNHNQTSNSPLSLFLSFLFITSSFLKYPSHYNHCAAAAVAKYFIICVFVCRVYIIYINEHTLHALQLQYAFHPMQYDLLQILQVVLLWVVSLIKQHNLQ